MLTLDLEPALLAAFQSASADAALATRLGALRARIVKQLGMRLVPSVERALGPRLAPRSEPELCRALAAGDGSAFAEVFERFAARLTRYAERSLCPADADEVAQQTFLHLVTNAKDLREPYYLESTLFSLLRQRILRELSRRARTRAVPFTSLSAEHEPEIEIKDDPTLALIANEERDRFIRALLEGLDDLEREVVVARCQEVPYEEIGQRFELDPGHARVIHHRAVQKLRRRLEERS